MVTRETLERMSFEVSIMEEGLRVLQLKLEGLLETRKTLIDGLTKAKKELVEARAKFNDEELDKAFRVWQPKMKHGPVPVLS